MRSLRTAPYWLLVLSVFGGGCPEPYEAEIVRDAWGVPHIYGDSAADVAYGLAHAQLDDGFATFANLLSATGRVGEVLPDPDGSVLAGDIAARRLRHREFAFQDFRKLSPALREVLIAYARGINDWVAASPFTVPAFDAFDVMAYQRHFFMRFAVNLADADANAATQDHPGIPPHHSNSWAAAPAKTASTSPLLLIDPHWEAIGSFQLYEAHLRGGALDVWGFTPGAIPLVTLGATARAAWTFTAGGADSADAYELMVNPANPNEYRYDGQWVPMILKTETFKRLGQPDHVETFRYTVHGPVYENASGVPYAAALPLWTDAQGLEQFWRMNTALSGADFEAALDLDRVTFLNLIWSTAPGDIGYAQLGAAPLRPAGYDWEALVPGWTSASRYLGQVPFSGLPQVYNPATGFLQNCNNAANEVTPGLTFTQEDFPPGVLYAHYGQYRARSLRATALLEAETALDRERAREIAFDTYTRGAELWVPILLQGLDEAGNPPEFAEARALLEGWDRFVDKDSEATTLFRFWRFAAGANPESVVGRDSWTVPNTPEIRAEAVEYLGVAQADMIDRYGTVHVPWGDVLRLVRGASSWPLSAGGGGGALPYDVLRAGGAPAMTGNQIVLTHGQVATSLVELGGSFAEPFIEAVVPFGQSNVPAAAHFADQAPLYAAHQLRKVPWSDAAIAAEETERKVVTSE